ncbi:uncharacterized protein BXZ73DRAFT_80546 [Epithele typhae]|uniref:uncharacterized protein n=1 Tax=Epithele typhae TaxID=378194 RepID=UPI0020089810|nr:uncharacterized protein BXZ73DRAFT_80546 [Epithele typhae]KAH9918536.1 hypothetical protein BXZ73DRAFT_80546 [Epithele typhae]
MYYARTSSYGRYRRQRGHLVWALPTGYSTATECTPITVFCASDEGSDVLGSFALTPHEWLIAEQLVDALKIFKDATEFFSRDTPNLAHIIPVMDKIDKELTVKNQPGSLFRPRVPYDPAIRAVFGFAKQMLHKYYDLTDSVEAYRIAMILHPTYKDDYFVALKWDEGMIETAIELVRDEFNVSYNAPDTHAASNSEDPVESDRQANNTAPHRVTAVLAYPVHPRVPATGAHP